MGEGSLPPPQHVNRVAPYGAAAGSSERTVPRTAHRSRRWQVLTKGRVKRKQVFLGYRDGIAGYIGASGVGVSTGAGDAPEAEAGALSAVGLHMDPTTDGHNWYWGLPSDLNVEHAIGFRVRYSSASATAADDRHWVVLYDTIAEDAALAIGTTALSTAIVAETDNGTANAWQWSPRGVLDGKTIAEARVSNQDLLAINLVLLLDDASEEMNMYGVQLDYVPKRYEGASQTYNGDYTTY